MIQPRSPLDAHDEPPDVRAVDGEILITGPHVDAAYTVHAARELAGRILALVSALERGPALWRRGKDRNSVGGETF